LESGLFRGSLLAHFFKPRLISVMSFEGLPGKSLTGSVRFFLWAERSKIKNI
jgi:hypothetical protein